MRLIGFLICQRCHRASPSVIYRLAFHLRLCRGCWLTKRFKEA